MLAELCNIVLLFKYELSNIQHFHYYFPNKYRGSQIIRDLYQFAQAPYFSMRN